MTSMDTRASAAMYYLINHTAWDPGGGAREERASMSTVVLDNVSKVYPGGYLAVDRLSLRAENGELLVLLGPSGCGKSTLLRMIAGLEEVSEGDLWLGGTLANDLAPRDRDVAMVFQNGALYPHRTVRDNIAFPLEIAKTDPTLVRERVTELPARGHRPHPAEPVHPAGLRPAPDRDPLDRPQGVRHLPVRRPPDHRRSCAG